MKRTVMKLSLVTSLIILVTALAAAQPTISSFSPASGPVGTSVTISGSGFDNVTFLNNIVYFGGVRATVTNVPSTSTLIATVPLGATYSPITVTKGGFTAYSNRSFVVTFGALPVIDASVFAGNVDYSVSPSTGSQAIALGDIDGDGKPDLVVANSGSGELRIIQNTGAPGGLTAGSFATPGYSFPAGSTPAALALGDLDGDGDLDIVVSDTSGGRIYIWENGTVPGLIDSASMSSIVVGTTPFGLAINDIDIDGKPDLFVALKGADSIAVLRNTSTLFGLSFARTNYSTGSGTAPVGVAVQGDLEGDGQLDVVTVNSANSRASVFLNGGSFPGTISLLAPSSFVLGSGSSSISLVDLNGDGKLDVVSSNRSANSVSLLRNTSSYPTLAFAPKVDIAAGTNPSHLGLSDLDGDGKPDIVVSNSSVDSVSVLRNTASGGAFSSATLASAVRFAVGNNPLGLALGDIDGDGKADILTANQSSNDVSVLRNKAIRVVAETGNDSTAATPISIGETIQSILDAPSDVDYLSFVLNPGDTVSIESHAVNNTSVTVRFEVFDTSGNYYKGRWEVVDDTTSWHVFAPSIGSARKFLLRVVSAYNSTSFPNARPGGDGPQMVPSSIAAPDSGYYQLSVDRYAPSAPRIYVYSNVYGESYNRAMWWTDFYPNGLSTAVSLEYSTSSDLSGSVLSPAPQSPATGINRTYFESPLTGLQPATRYYYRMVATNALGTAYSEIFQFTTPPAPIGWVHQDNGSNTTVTGISYGDDTTGIAVGYNYSNSWRRTTDGGTTWTSFTHPDGQALYGVWMLNSSLGFAVGSNESIIKTTDGGANWTSLTSTGSGYSLWRVKFVNPLAGIAVGDGGLIVKTANSGASWTQVRVTDGFQLRGIDYADLNTVVAVGGGGTILRSTNGGTNWDSIPSPTSAFLYGVDFISSSVGYIAAGNGILKSTNGGLSWTQLSVPNSTSFYDIAFKDANNGIIVGASGRILRTSDGGATWDLQVTGTRMYLYSASYRGRILAVGGEDGLVLSSLDPKSESEPNDDIASALRVALRDDVDASIQPTGDVDYFKLVLSADDSIAVSVVSRDTAYVNGLLELLDSGGIPIGGASNDDFVPGDTTQSRVFYIAAPGTYYARFSAVTGGTGNYRIRFRQAKPQPAVPFGGTASILTLSDVTITAPIVPNNASTNVQFEYGLNTSYGSTVPADVTPVAGQELIAATTTLTGLTPFTTYHFRVKADNAYGTTYGPDVTFQTVLGTLRSESEANNTSSQANTVFIGDTVDGVISTNTDVDYYRFQAAAGDTLEVYAYPTGSSDAHLRIQVIDSASGNYRVDNYYIPAPNNVHSTFRVFNTGVYFLRVTYSYNYNTFYPSQKNDGPLPRPQLPMVAPTATADIDTGSYQIRLARFTPSAPDLPSYVYLESLFSDNGILASDIAPNGLPTTVTMEYGTSISYGQSAVMTGPPLDGIQIQNVQAPISGLLPNTTYHYRAKGENSAGISYSKDNTFKTPLPPDGWVQLQTGTTNYLEDIDIVSDSIIVAVGGNTIVRTSDAGATWTQTTPGASLYTVNFANKDTGIAAGWDIVGTTNGGATWSYLGYINNLFFEDLQFVNSSTAIGVGAQYDPSFGNYRARIVRTTDGGATWSVIKSSTVNRFWSIDILNKDTALVAGAEGWVFRTFDLSAATPTWDSVSVGNTNWIQDIEAVDVDNYTVVFDTYSGSNQLLRTTNGGTSWIPISLPDYTRYNFVQHNGLQGVVAGEGGAIYRTTDGGATWFRQEGGVWNAIYNGEYEGRYIYVVGMAGTVMRYADPLGEIEPNDAAGSANAVAIGDQVDGTIDVPGDLDFFSFGALAGDTLEVFLTQGGAPSVNGALQLVGTDGSSVLAQNDDFVQGDTTAARVVYAFTAPGTYYVRVAGSTGSSTGSYLLKLSRTSLKPRIASVDANPSPTSVSITGLVDPNNLSTTVEIEYGLTTSYGTIIPAVGSPFAATQQRQSFSTTITSLQEDQDYHFRILASNTAGSVTGIDRIFHTPKASAIAEAEPNDSAHLAQLIAYSDSVDGSISPLNDVDYFKMHISAGDTLETFITRRGASTLYGRIQLIDSAGQFYYDDIDWFPRNDSLHLINYFDQSTTVYLRYRYSYNYTTTFPGEKDDEGILPVLKTANAPFQTASQDTGEYRLYVRRFSPSAPEGEDYVGWNRLYYNSAKLSTTIRANGLPTTVNFEYGTTQSYGSQIAADNGPFAESYRQNATSALLTGLLPNTSYYARTVLTNSLGTTYGGGNISFTTPAPPEGWTYQTSGVETLLRDAEFPSESVGYAVGSAGVILKTTNGGTGWVAQSGGIGYTLNSSSFFSTTVGMIAGGGGTILKTTNGGTDWILQTTNTGAFLYAVRMINANNAVAVGAQGTILRTTNSGTNWDSVRTGPSDERFRALSFSPAGDTGYAVGYTNADALIMKTTDGGATWQYHNTITGNYLLSVHFFNGSTGVVGGQNRVFYRTTDGGATWNTYNASGNGYNIYGMAFADTSNGVAASDNGGTFRTYDGGRTWLSQNSGTQGLIYGAAMKGRSATLVGEWGLILNAVGLLATPTSLTATYAGGNSVDLSWNDLATGETGYFVERKAGMGGSYSVVQTPGANAVSASDAVTRGAIYYYRVRAFNAVDTSGYSSEDSAFVPLITPTSLVAASGGASSINLSWQANADARDGYKIERGTSAAGPYSEIATVGAGATTYQNTGLSSASKYFYRVRSYNVVMQSAYSNIDSANTALGKPQNVTSGPNPTNGPITISWSGPGGAVNALYVVDTPPALGPPATSVPVNNNSFVLTNPPNGQRWVYFYLEDANGLSDPLAYDSASTWFDNVVPVVQDQTVLPTITITGSAVSDPTTVPITANITKPGGTVGLLSATLEYKKTNSQSITQSSFPALSGGTVNLSNLSSLFLTIGKPNGVEYRIKAVDQAGNTGTSSWRSFTVFVNSPPVSDFVPPAAGTGDDITTLVSNYRLFSVPYDLQDKKPIAFMETVDKGLGPHAKDGVNYYNWRMERYVNGTYQGYEDFKNLDAITPGTAFFMISRTQKSITVGSGNLVKAQDMYNNGIQVLQGWNLVGNPFPDDFPADSLFLLAGTISDKAYYDGTGPDGGWWKTGANILTLKKWEGLAINASQNTTLKFRAVPQTSVKAPIPAPLAKSAKQEIEEKKEGGWVMRIDAHRSGSPIVDVGNTIGEVPGAEEGRDQFDSFQPPILPGKSLALYFRNPDGAMSSDMRPIQTDGSTWDMKVVTGDRGARVRLDVTDVVPLPDLSLEAYLLDIEDQMAHNLKEQRKIEFGSKEGVRNFRIIVGSKSFVDSVSTSLGIDLVPQQFMLYQNYPNPFNPETALRFWLPGASPSYKVTLKVYNIIGQEVVTLIDGDMRPGYYERTFSGRNLASGTYIYRLTVIGGTKETTFSAVKKMVMVK